MAIGQVRLSGAPQEYLSDQPGRRVSGALETVADSISSFGGSLAQIQQSLLNEQKRREGFDADTQFYRFQGQLDREQQDALVNAPVDGGNLTEGRLAQLQKQGEEFLLSLPESQRERYRPIVEKRVQDLTTSTYSSEYKLRTDYEVKELGDTVGSLAGDILNGKTTPDAAFSIVSDLVAKSALTEAGKIAALEGAQADLLGAEFESELRRAKAGRGTVREADGKDVVAAGLSPWERGFLNATSARESGGDYYLRYDGGAGSKFTDTSDHPRVFVKTPSGDLSSAAGRYMITASTWDDLVGRYGREVLPDFSPESQDRAAILLARERYNAQIGAGELTFDQALQSGDDRILLAVKAALAPTWEAFKHMDDREFLNIFKGVQGVAGGGTGSGRAPDVWNDPRYAGLPFERKLAMESSAAKAVEDMQSMLDQQKQQTEDLLRAQIEAGAAGRKEVDEAIAAGQVKLSAADDLLRLTREAGERQKAAAGYEAAAKAGTILPSSEENRKAALTYFEQSGVMAGMQQLDAAAANQFANVVSRTGVMPKEMESLLTSMAASADPRQARYAYDTLVSMKQKAPAQFASLVGEELFKRTGLFETALRYTPQRQEQKLMERIQEFYSPEVMQLREVFKDQIKKNLEGVTPDTITQAFDTSMFPGGVPAMPVSRQAAALLMSDTRALYTEAFPLFQDHDATMEYVTKQLGARWAPDTVGGTNRLSYLSPASDRANYPVIGGSRDWVRSDILLSQGWPSDTQFEVIVPPQGEAEAAAGRPAPFMINRRDAEGNWAIEMDPKTGLPKLFRPSISPELKEGYEAKWRQENLDAQLQDVQQHIIGLQLQLEGADETKRVELAAELSAFEQKQGTLMDQIGELDPVAERARVDVMDLIARRDKYIERRDRHNPQSSSYIAHDRWIKELDEKIAKALGDN